MVGVLQGFALILTVIGVGYLTALFGIVKGDQRRVLNDVAFFVATPLLLFSVLYDADPSVMLSPVILVSTAAALVVAALYTLASRLWFRQHLGPTVLGATTTAYVNSNNLGLPVAVYILGDAAYVAPLMLVQLIIFTPVILVLLEAARGGGSGLGGKLTRAMLNPVLVASVLGFVCALLKVDVPEIALGPIRMIGAAAIPMILISFGISLRGQRALQAGTGRTAVLTAITLKVLIMPAVAFLIARLLGLAPHETFIATTIAALPTAQNIYNYAATYRMAEIPVRDTIFVATFASLPVIAAVAWLLGG